MIDLRGLIANVERSIATCALGPPGTYRRWPEGAGDSDLNPYGCADAANLLYTIGRFPRDPAERRGWIETLQDLQDPATGLFRESTHHELHTTAHCLAALELFDAGPRHPLSALAPLREPQAMQDFLDGLDWRRNPWIESHRGAGLYAAFVLADREEPIGLDWRDRYFAWLHDRFDPRTGLLRGGCVPDLDGDGALRIFPHLAGTFHYLFNLEHARRALPFPEALVDTCLILRERELYPFATSVGFAEVDWVYCLTRSLRQSGHRHLEATAALERFAERYVAFLESLDFERDEGWNDLHRLFGAVCALAELQAALPGRLRTERPLRLVLDRRPFI
jgi:hypothetical protein